MERLARSSPRTRAAVVIAGMPRWHGHEVRTVRIQTTGGYRGPRGLSGLIEIWVSDDEHALPDKAAMNIKVGWWCSSFFPKTVEGERPSRRSPIP